MRGRKLMQQFPPENRTDAICIDCIGDEILKNFFSGTASEPCSICKKNEFVTTTGEFLANSSRSIIQAHFKEYSKSDGDNATALTLNQVLKEVTRIDNDNFCQTMANYIVDHPRSRENGFFKLEKFYLDVHIQSEPNKDQWDSIALDLVHRQRYFNQKAEKYFEILINEAVSAKTKSLFGNIPAAEKLIKTGQILYRARKLSPSVEKEIADNPSEALGAPPKKVAAHNRMNPAGISLFYSAENKETAIAEIRPSIGDTVSVGKFKTTRDLKFFDFRWFNVSPIRKKVSHWYDFYKDTINARAFLGLLHEAISQPVSNGETGYIITQAFTEYLRHRHDGEFDGLIFNSVQNNSGVNYVVFSEKSKDSDSFDKDWEPKFPLDLSNSPEFHKINTIKYIID